MEKLSLFRSMLLRHIDSYRPLCSICMHVNIDMSRSRDVYSTHGRYRSAWNLHLAV